MNFKEALASIKKGETIRRYAWPNGPYLTWESGVIAAYFELILPFEITSQVLSSKGWLVDGAENQLAFLDLIPHLKQGHKAKYAAKLEGTQDQIIYYDRDSHQLVTTTYEKREFNLPFEALIANDWTLKP